MQDCTVVPGAAVHAAVAFGCQMAQSSVDCMALAGPPGHLTAMEQKFAAAGSLGLPTGKGQGWSHGGGWVGVRCGTAERGVVGSSEKCEVWQVQGQVLVAVALAPATPHSHEGMARPAGAQCHLCPRSGWMHPLLALKHSAKWDQEPRRAEVLPLQQQREVRVCPPAILWAGPHLPAHHCH